MNADEPAELLPEIPAALDADSTAALADEPVPSPPKPPHPGFLWGIVWMFLFLLLCQGGGIAVVVGTILWKMLLGPDGQQLAEKMSDIQEFQKSREFADLLWPGLLAAQVFTILFSLAALRLVAGRDWPRQVALRRPSLRT